MAGEFVGVEVGVGQGLVCNGAPGPVLRGDLTGNLTDSPPG